MPHSKHVITQPHPQNAERTHTLILNTDCPRCGGSLDDVYAEPGDLLHCPHCRGALESCARLEDGGTDRSANVVTIAWLQPSDFVEVAGSDCDCAGCEFSRQPPKPEGSR